MDYNNLIISLIEKYEAKLDKKTYDQYISTLDKLKISLENFNKVLELDDNDLNLISEKANVTGLRTIIFFITGKLNFVDSEAKKAISNCIDEVSAKFNEDQAVKIYIKKSDELEKLRSIVANNFSEDEQLILNFINQCFNDNLIDTTTAINLIFYVTSKKVTHITESNQREATNNQEEVIINENKTNIYDDVVRLLNYDEDDYDKLNSKIKKDLEKYGKIDYAEEIMKFLKNYSLSEEDFLSHQKMISKLIIFQDKSTFDEINTFINSNGCTLNRLLSFGSIFFRRSRQFKFKNTSGKIIVPPKNSPSAPCGNFESFMYCVSLYKKVNGLPDTYEMTDEDFIKQNGVSMIGFFTTPKEKIERNLTLLQKYGFIEKGELPHALLSLTGKNTEYLLDRLIESGLYEHGKKFPYILTSNSSPFRWYKIKRARDLGEPVIEGKGLRNVLKDCKKPFMGINWNNETQVIDQEPIPADKLVSGGRRLPVHKKEDEFSEFNAFYKYSIYEPHQIFEHEKLSYSEQKRLASKGLLIDAVFKGDYKDVSERYEAENDEYVKLLDKYFLVNDLTYGFYSPKSGIWPAVSILVSRPKVIRLVELLKSQNFWIKNNTLDLEKEDLLLSVIVKDSVLSDNELFKLREMIHGLVIKKYSATFEKGRGV